MILATAFFAVALAQAPLPVAPPPTQDCYEYVSAFAMAAQAAYTRALENDADVIWPPVSFDSTAAVCSNRARPSAELWGRLVYLWLRLNRETHPPTPQPARPDQRETDSSKLSSQAGRDTVAAIDSTLVTVRRKHATGVATLPESDVLLCAGGRQTDISDEMRRFTANCVYEATRILLDNIKASSDAQLEFVQWIAKHERVHDAPPPWHAGGDTTLSSRNSTTEFDAVGSSSLSRRARFEWGFREAATLSSALRREAVHHPLAIPFAASGTSGRAGAGIMLLGRRSHWREKSSLIGGASGYWSTSGRPRPTGDVSFGAMRGRVGLLTGLAVRGQPRSVGTSATLIYAPPGTTAILGARTSTLDAFSLVVGWGILR